MLAALFEYALSFRKFGGVHGALLWHFLVGFIPASRAIVAVARPVLRCLIMPLVAGIVHVAAISLY